MAKLLGTGSVDFRYSAPTFFEDDRPGRSQNIEGLRSVSESHTYACLGRRLAKLDAMLQRPSATKDLRTLASDMLSPTAHT